MLEGTLHSYLLWNSGNKARPKSAVSSEADSEQGGETIPLVTKGATENPLNEVIENEWELGTAAVPAATITLDCPLVQALEQLSAADPAPSAVAVVDDDGRLRGSLSPGAVDAAGLINERVIHSCASSVILIHGQLRFLLRLVMDAWL